MASQAGKKEVIVIPEEDPDDWPDVGPQNPEEADSYIEKINNMIGTVYPNSSLKCNLLIYFQDPVSWHLPKSYKEHLVTAHVLCSAVNHAQCWPIGAPQA